MMMAQKETIERELAKLQVCASVNEVSEDNSEFNDCRAAKGKALSVKGTGYNAAITRNHDPADGRPAN